MKQNKSKIFILIGFIITFITLLTFFLVTYYSLKATISHSKEEQFVLKMIRHLDNLQLSISDIEATERLFLISIETDKKIVQKFTEAETNYNKELAVLKELSGNNILPGNDILQLILLAEKKLSFSKEIIFLSSHGNEKAALAALLNNEDAFDIPLKNQYNKVSEIGRNLLTSFDKEHNTNAQKAYNLFGLLSVVAFGLISYSFYRILQRTKLINSLSLELAVNNNELEERVKSQTHLVSEMFERISDGFTVFDKDLNITYTNAYLGNIVKRPVSSLIGNNLVKDFGHLKITKLIEGAFIGQQFLHTEFYSEFFKKWFNINLYPSPNGLTVYYQDISEKKQMQEELEQAQLQYRNLVENASDVIGIVNDKGYILKTNSTVETMFGYTKEETLSMNLTDFFFPEYIINNPIDLTKIPKVGFLQVIGKYRKKDGTAIYAELNSSRLPDGTYMGVVRDITERRKQENEIRNLVNFIEHSSALIGTMSLDRKITYINKAARDAIGIDANTDVSEMDALQFFSKGITPSEEILAEVKTKGFWEGENILISLSGKKTPILQLVLLHRNKKGEPSFISSNGIDITELKEKQEILFRERDFLIKLIDNLPGIFCMYNKNGDVYKWNKNFEEITGYSFEEIKKMHLLDFYDADEHVIIKKRLEKIFSGEITKAVELKIVSKNKKKTPLALNGWCIDYNSEPVLVSMGLDLTELKEKEHTVNKLDSIIKYSNTYAAITDIQTKKTVFINAAFRKRLEVSEDEDININEFHSEEEHQFFKDKIMPNILAKGRWNGEYSFRSRSNEKIEVIAEFLFHKDEQDSPKEISVTAIDISELKEKEKEILKLNNELRQLTTHLQNITEAERSAIAKEIHDDFAQKLVALSINAAWLKNTIKDKSKEVKEILDDQRSIADSVISTSRTLFNSLHPSMLDEIGLEAAITWYAKSQIKVSNLQLEIQSDINDEMLPKEINIGLFRIFQNSFSNVLCHSKATKVSINLSKPDKIIIMSIDDNGVGFNIDAIDMSNSNGLLEMRERVYAMNGKLLIESNPGTGTKIEVQIPIFTADDKREDKLLLQQIQKGESH